MRFLLTPHVMAGVRDLGDAVAFYRDVLGMEVRRVTREGAELACGPMTFHVAESPEPSVGFAFRVPSAEEARRLLTESGCAIVAEHSDRSFTAADPYGLRFRVTE